MLVFLDVVRAGKEVSAEGEDGEEEDEEGAGGLGAGAGVGGQQQESVIGRERIKKELRRAKKMMVRFVGSLFSVVQRRVVPFLAHLSPPPFNPDALLLLFTSPPT